MTLHGGVIEQSRHLGVFDNGDRATELIQSLSIHVLLHADAPGNQPTNTMHRLCFYYGLLRKTNPLPYPKKPEQKAELKNGTLENTREMYPHITAKRVPVLIYAKSSVSKPLDCLAKFGIRSAIWRCVLGALHKSQPRPLLPRYVFNHER